MHLDLLNAKRFMTISHALCKYIIGVGGGALCALVG